MSLFSLAGIAVRQNIISEEISIAINSLPEEQRADARKIVDNQISTETIMLQIAVVLVLSIIFALLTSLVWGTMAFVLATLLIVQHAKAKEDEEYQRLALRMEVNPLYWEPISEKIYEARQRAWERIQARS